MATTLIKYISAALITIVVVISGMTIQWAFNKDYSTLSRDGVILAKERWHVEAERTYFNLDSYYNRIKCKSILAIGGHNTTTRCYYPDDYYEALSRSLINTQISELNDTVYRVTPYYMYGTTGAYAGNLEEFFNFREPTTSELEFPESYQANWTPKDTRNYKLVWRVWNLKGNTLPVGIYHGCRYTTPYTEINLKEDCSKLDYAEVKDSTTIWFYFKPDRGIQSMNVDLTDPIGLETQLVFPPNLTNLNNIATLQTFTCNITDAESTSGIELNIWNSTGKDVSSLNKRGYPYDFSRFGSRVADFAAYLGVTSDTNGNIIAVGEYDISPRDDAIISKYDNNLNLLFNLTYGGVNLEWAEEVVTDSNNNIFVGLCSNDFGTQKMVLLKLDSNGNYQWNQTYNPGCLDGMAIDGLNNIYLSGKDTRHSGVSPYVDSILIKVNTTGGELWNNSYTGYDNDYGYGVALDSSGNIYQGGGTYSMSYGNTYSESFIIKFDTNGNQMWNRTYGMPTVHDWTYDLKIDRLDNLYIGGYSGNPAMIAKVNSVTGNQIWNKTRTWGTAVSNYHNVEISPMGDVYGIGTDTSDSYYHIVIKYDSNGAQYWNFSSFSGTGDTDSYDYSAIIVNDSLITVGWIWNSSGYLPVLYKTTEYYKTVNSTSAQASWNIEMPYYDNFTWNCKGADTSYNYDWDIFNYTLLVKLVTDTCTYGGSGDWNVACSDNCVISTPTTLSANTLNLYGAGTFTVMEDISVNRVVKQIGCKLINLAKDGKRLIIKLG